MERRLLLNVVVGKATSILKLLAGKDETLLIGRNAFLILNLLLYHLNRVTRLRLQRNGLACQGLDEDLHLEFSLVVVKKAKFDERCVLRIEKVKV